MDSYLDTLSPWLAVPAIVLLVLGSGITLVGTLGLLRLPNFYQRIHGPAITITLGTGSILISSMLIFSGLQSRLVVHEVLITVFIMLTAPVTAMFIMRAAFYRERRREQRLLTDSTNAQASIDPDDHTSQ